MLNVGDWIQRKRGDGMSEAIAFLAGMIAMMIVWFINDNSTSTSPYRRGFEDGYKKAMKDYEAEGSEE